MDRRKTLIIGSDFNLVRKLVDGEEMHVYPPDANQESVKTVFNSKHPRFVVFEYPTTEFVKSSIFKTVMQNGKNAMLSVIVIIPAGTVLPPWCRVQFDDLYINDIGVGGNLDRNVELLKKDYNVDINTVPSHFDLRSS
jgi:hypothetical protein